MEMTKLSSSSIIHETKGIHGLNKSSRILTWSQGRLCRASDNGDLSGGAQALWIIDCWRECLNGVAVGRDKGK